MLSRAALIRSRSRAKKRRDRAERHYKQAKIGSLSAKYWLGRRNYFDWLIARRTKQIRAATPKPDARQRIVNVAQMCARNYRKNPGAYHYLAGGIPNTIIDRPTPRSYRSDCSQFAVGVYKMAGLKCPGSGTFMHSNTISIANGNGRVTQNPRPGDLGMYGSRHAPHHVEVYIGNGDHIGHGTVPIDNREPGRPSFYLSFLP
ncbi:MAG TPA: NlpC/P60 family protein [Vicinamibacterales bacterium]|nr:NlpC/P60 family protein [Vicinamibacterales bacterium]